MSSCSHISACCRQKYLQLHHGVFSSRFDGFYLVLNSKVSKKLWLQQHWSCSREVSWQVQQDHSETLWFVQASRLCLPEGSTSSTQINLCPFVAPLLRGDKSRLQYNLNQSTSGVISRNIEKHCFESWRLRRVFEVNHQSTPIPSFLFSTGMACVVVGYSTVTVAVP